MELSEPIVTETIAGGSGIIAHGRKYHVVSDAMPWLFRLNKKLDIEDKVSLLNTRKLDMIKGVMTGSVKPDYEALSKVKYMDRDWAIVLGSGGKSTLRERGHMVQLLGESIYSRSITSLYDQLKQAAGFCKKQRLNVEGLTTTGEYAYIFHRGNFTDKSFIFKLKEIDLIRYMAKEKNRINFIQVAEVMLPSIDGTQAALSGGDFSSKNNAIIFTASVESDKGENSGETVGSFIGVLPIAYFTLSETIDLRALSQRIEKNGYPIVTKLESAGIIYDSVGQIDAVLLSDNDDDASEFFKTTFKVSAVFE